MPDVQCEHRGRSIGMRDGLEEKKACGMTLPWGGSVQHSLSPMDAEGGAVMEPGCRNALPAGGQYCSHSKRING